MEQHPSENVDINDVIVATGVAQQHLKVVLGLIKNINRQLHKTLHFECFVMNTYLQVVLEVSAQENAPAHIFFKDKNFWMKIRSQAWWLYVLNHFDEDEWLENFRVSKQTYLYICDRLRVELEPVAVEPNLQPREPVSVEKKIALTLYFLASCSEYRTVGHLFGIHKSTVAKYIHQVVRLINSILLPEEITMPDRNECEIISRYFYERYGIIRIIGSLDGSHVPILPPSEGYRDFVNRKGWPSVVLQALVDHKMLFRNINCQNPGCSHDAAVLARSGLYKNHQNLIPQDSITVEGIEVPWVIVGDSAYPLQPWLVKRYPGDPQGAKGAFNRQLSSLRVVVECAFGRLQARFRCLLKRLDVNYKFATEIVGACCTLHNIVEKSGEPFPEEWLHRANEHNYFPQPNEQEFAGEDDATHVRDALYAHFLANFWNQE